MSTYVPIHPVIKGLDGWMNFVSVSETLQHAKVKYLYRFWLTNNPKLTKVLNTF